VKAALRPLAAALLGALLAGPQAQAQVQIRWQSMNGGGGTVSNATYRLSSSVGQSAAGYVQNQNNLHWIGFWAGEVQNPTVAGSIYQAKLLPDGTLVSLAGMIASSSTGDFSGMSGGFFYMQSPDRSGGLRVSVPAAQVAGLTRGQVVNVMGPMATTPSGERHITGPMIILGAAGTAPVPLTMNNRSVGGQTLGSPPQGQAGVADPYGLNNVGLLVRTTGRVVSQEGDYLVIDDGSADPAAPGSRLFIDRTHLAAPPAVGSTVIVVGVSSLHKPGEDRMRLVIPRTSGDVTLP